MYISDVVLEKDNLGLVTKRIRFATLFIVLFVLGALASAGVIVYSLVTKTANLDTYLYNGASIFIALFWVVFASRENFLYKGAKTGIETVGSFTIVGKVVQVDAKHKYNVYTIVNLICAILVFACFVGSIVVQALGFNAELLYTVALSFVLTSFLTYQTIVGFIDDKMYRKVIFASDEEAEEIVEE